MKRSFIAYGITALGLLSFPQRSRAVFDVNQAQEADGAYQQGNCRKAIRDYWFIQQNIDAPKDLQELALFRLGYCLLQIGRPADSAESFASYLRHFPDNDEARLRYAQALFQSKNTRDAFYNALEVKEGPFASEATLLAAQAEIELGKYEDAVDRLSHTRTSADWRPAYAYWIGVAKYHENDLKGAKTYFLYASSLAPPNHWARSEALAWLDKIHQDEQNWHGSAVLGYFTDTNVGQDSIVTTDALGNPTETPPVPPSYYHDAGFYAGAELDYRVLQNANWALNSFASASSSAYQTYTSYSAQSLVAGLGGTYRAGPSTTLGLTGKYLDTRYAYNYYQDYLVADPSLGAWITPRFYIYLDTPYTWYVFTREYRTFAMNLNARFQFDGWRLFGGAGYLRARGSQATFYASGGLAYVSTGEMFVNYETTSRYLGGSIDLPWSLYLTGQCTWSSTHYDSEALPQGSLQYGSSDRQDKQTVYSLEAGRAMMPGVWTISLSYAYTQNISSGLQGIAYDGEQTDYTYNRSYTMLKTTFTF